MSSQQKRLEDGTPYVGQLGELAYDPDEDKVQCHLCGGWYHVPGERRDTRVRPSRTLAAQHPELVRELDSERNETLDPAVIAANSRRKLWWRCPDCGHQWQAAVRSRAAGHGCPECYSERRRAQGPRAVSAEQSLQAGHPALAAEWDRGRNRGLDPAAISPKSKHKV